MAHAPASRVTTVRDLPVNPRGRYVLYWMIAARRSRWNYALQHAVEHARRLAKPLLVLEPLRCDYPWASDRLHAFILQGMAAQAVAMEGKPVTYHPWVESTPGGGRGLLEALSAEACLVVTDEFPSFFLPRMVGAAAARSPVRMETVDGNGVLPLRASPRAFSRAFDFRRHLQRVLPDHIEDRPLPDPLARLRLPPLDRPPAALRRWPAATAAMLRGDPASLRSLPIDHGVPVVGEQGGQDAARRRLRAFVGGTLENYSDARRHPDGDGSSGLSPWLHFGHLSPHEVFDAAVAGRKWSPGHAGKATGAREGWWGLPPDVEAFLDQLITWRELGLNFAHHRPGDEDRFEGLPDWARATLEEHRGDRRAELPGAEALEAARSGDALWNAAQRQLRAEGRIHNVVRMNWGKSVLSWTRHPREAFDLLVHLNNRWALDGRDPNSYSGIGWCLGRFDRAWGPERPIFGKVRYMTTESTRRKVRLRRWLERWSEPSLF